MSRLNVANFRHPDATADAITLTNSGDTQINRALGLGGATYGTSGQVLTSAGSGAVPTWTTPAAAGLTKTTNASTDISGATTFMMSGIDADAEEIHMYWSDFYTAGGVHFHFRFGTEESGGTIYTTGYESHSHFSNGTTGMSYDTTIVNFAGAGSGASSTHHGQIRISKRSDFNYYFQAYTAHETAGYWWLTQGTWTGSAALTRIQWITAGGSALISAGNAQIATFA